MDNDLGQIVDALPGLVWTAYPDGSVEFLNAQCREQTLDRLPNARYLAQRQCARARGNSDFLEKALQSMQAWSINVLIGQ